MTVFSAQKGAGTIPDDMICDIFFAILCFKWQNPRFICVVKMGKR